MPSVENPLQSWQRVSHMSRHLIAVRSAGLGLLIFAALLWIEQLLLRWTGPILGLNWLPTAQVALECLAFAGTGWLIGRWGRSGVLIFAGIIAVQPFARVPGIDVGWLFRLLMDSFQDSRYLASFFNSLGTHLFLIASLFVGAHWSRPRERTVLRIQ